MGRSVVTTPKSPVVRQAFPDLENDASKAERGTAQQSEKSGDTYRDRLFKYIPAEVVTLYLALNATLASAGNTPQWLHWVIIIVGLIGTPFYLWFAQKVRVRLQLIISTVAFLVWVFALGGPFTEISGYKPVYGALLLPIFTFFVAYISPPPPRSP